MSDTKKDPLAAAVDLLRAVPVLATNRDARNLLLDDAHVVISSDQGAAHLVSIVKHVAAKSPAARQRFVDRAKLFVGDTASGEALNGLSKLLDSLHQLRADPPTPDEARNTGHATRAGLRHVVVWRSRNLSVFQFKSCPNGWTQRLAVSPPARRPTDPREETASEWLDSELRVKRRVLLRARRLLLKLEHREAELTDEVVLVPALHEVVAVGGFVAFATTIGFVTWLATTVDGVLGVPWAAVVAALGAVLAFGPFIALRECIRDLWIARPLLSGLGLLALSAMLWLAPRHLLTVVHAADADTTFDDASWRPNERRAVWDLGSREPWTTRAKDWSSSRAGCDIEVAKSTPRVGWPFTLFAIPAVRLAETCDEQYRQVASCSATDIEVDVLDTHGESSQVLRVDDTDGWVVDVTTGHRLGLYEKLNLRPPMSALLWRFGDDPRDVAVQDGHVVVGNISVGSEVLELDWYEDEGVRPAACRVEPRELKLVVNGLHVRAQGTLGASLVRTSLGAGLDHVVAAMSATVGALEQHADVDARRRHVWHVDVFQERRRYDVEFGTERVSVCRVCARDDHRKCRFERVRATSRFDEDTRTFSRGSVCG